MLQGLLDAPQRSALTPEEQQLRREENSRKRKNLKEKRLAAEKRDTINKLLKRRAGTAKAGTSGAALGDSGDMSTARPRRPYSSSGMSRTLRTARGDVFCPVADV